MRKLSRLVGLFVGLFVVVAMGAGCGARTESRSYFYSPGWTRGGAIIFVGELDTVEKDVLGSQLSSSYSQYVRTIYPAGTGESAVLFDSTGNPPYAMSCSPTGDYVVYGNDLRNGLFRTLVIQNIASGVHTGLERLELSFNPGVLAFDWSNNGQKIVYCTSTEVRTVNIDGSGDTLVTAEAGISCVSWKYGSRIALVRAVGGAAVLSLINPNSGNRTDLAAADSVDLPQISAVDNNEIVGISGTDLVKIVTGGVVAKTVIKANFTGLLPRLSPDATLVTYSKSGEQSGVYTLTMAGVETKVK